MYPALCGFPADSKALLAPGRAQLAPRLTADLVGLDFNSSLCLPGPDDGGGFWGLDLKLRGCFCLVSLSVLSVEVLSGSF